VLHLQCADIKIYIVYYCAVIFNCFAEFYVHRVNLWSMDKQSWSDLGWISHVLRLFSTCYGTLRGCYESLESHTNLLVWVMFSDSKQMTENISLYFVDVQRHLEVSLLFCSYFLSAKIKQLSKLVHIAQVTVKIEVALCMTTHHSLQQRLKHAGRMSLVKTPCVRLT